MNSRLLTEHEAWVWLACIIQNANDSLFFYVQPWPPHVKGRLRRFAGLCEVVYQLKKDKVITQETWEEMAWRIRHVVWGRSRGWKYGGYLCKPGVWHKNGVRFQTCVMLAEETKPL